jgi:peptidoglycan-associated lipoprotein
MTRKPAVLLISLLLLFAVACAKKDGDIPIPVEPPEVPKIEKPAEEVKPTPPPKVEPVAEPDPLEGFSIEDNPMNDVYFEFDKSELTEDTKAALQRYAEVLKAYEGLKVLIEGHCDERGTDEYNLALGENRATRVREYLVSLGVGGQYLKTISYGESRPAVDESNEEAWSKNRRAHFLVSKN